eukprot:TRINITY_DN16607_c0_g1_i1.p1 TRINITY_DN16607_c0_g1~~TRINITY_DN16607_c0_g1_i1.p1  ORF type:complete len:131 (-),score=18.55 TRINITY_DN16607_c0_g1_i1:98-490(-)
MYTVICAAGVRLRNTPNFEDVRSDQATSGGTLTGNMVCGQNGIYYLQTQNGEQTHAHSAHTGTGYVPFYKPDGSPLLAPVDQVEQYQVAQGMEFRRTANFHDLKHESGQVVVGQSVMGCLLYTSPSPRDS